MNPTMTPPLDPVDPIDPIDPIAQWLARRPHLMFLDIWMQGGGLDVLPAPAQRLTWRCSSVA